MPQPIKFPIPPPKPLRERIREAETAEEVRQLALRMLDEIEQTSAGRQCLLCAAPCMFAEDLS